MINKYIFLDIDGVLNTEKSWKIKNYMLNENSIKELARLYKKMNARIILTSTWKNGWSKNYNLCTPQIQELIKIFNKYNMVIYDKTPNWPVKKRSDEILAYVKRNNITDYIILDDDISLFDKNTLNLYIVNSKLGFTNYDFLQISNKKNA